MICLKRLIDYSEFDKFYFLNKSNTTTLGTSKKKASPSKKYLFRVFNFSCKSSYDQKVILETFSQISNKENQYLQSYSKFSFFFQSHNTPTFAMKFISSNTLEKVLNNSNILTTANFEKIMNCIFAVSEAMNFLHNHLIYHGNLCPSNIIIDEAEQFYVCDFGLYPIKNLYVKENEIFNPDYKDPSMTNNIPSFTSDVYSFGVLVCQLFLKYLQLKNDKNRKEENLKEFIQKNDENKFNKFPSFCSFLIPACLNASANKRPTFSQIIEIFKSTKYDEGEMKISQLYKNFSSTNYIENLASKGNLYAMNKIARMYEKGGNIQKDDRKASEFYQKAADQNYSDAQNNYGLFLQEKNPNDEEKMTLGAEYLKKSADQGNINGMASYGTVLYYGDGVEPNKEEAKNLLKKSADLGLSYSQANYGYLLLNNDENEHLTKEQINDALLYIRKAMDQKNPEAFWIYGVLLKYGKNVEKNVELAMENFKIAADNGYENAIVEYAKGCLSGFGVQKNEKMAMKYFQMAGEKGNKSAKNTFLRLLKNNKNLGDFLDQSKIEDIEIITRQTSSSQNLCYSSNYQDDYDNSSLPTKSENEFDNSSSNESKSKNETEQSSSSLQNENDDFSHDKSNEHENSSSKIQKESNNFSTANKSVDVNRNINETGISSSTFKNQINSSPFKKVKNNHPFSANKKSPQIKETSSEKDDLFTSFEIAPPIKESTVILQNGIQIKLPFQVSSKIKLISLGEIVFDRNNYYNENYIFPVGYEIEKEYYSIDDPRNQTLYRASILDGGNSPVFRVQCFDKTKKVFEGSNPSDPWKKVCIEINNSKKNLGMQSRDSASISGPCSFGLVLNIISYMIEKLPNADKCVNHSFKKLFVSGIDEVIDGGRELNFMNISNISLNIKKNSSKQMQNNSMKNSEDDENETINSLSQSENEDKITNDDENSSEKLEENQSSNNASQNNDDESNSQTSNENCSPSNNTIKIDDNRDALQTLDKRRTQTKEKEIEIIDVQSSSQTDDEIVIYSNDDEEKEHRIPTNKVEINRDKNSSTDEEDEEEVELYENKNLKTSAKEVESDAQNSLKNEEEEEIMQTVVENQNQIKEDEFIQNQNELHKDLNHPNEENISSTNTARTDIDQSTSQISEEKHQSPTKEIEIIDVSDSTQTDEEKLPPSSPSSSPDELSISETTSSSDDDEEEPINSQQIDYNQPTESLIALGDELLSKNKVSKALKCYLKAADDGNGVACLKYADLSPEFETRNKYYRLAIDKKVPESFSKWRKDVMKQMSTKVYKGRFKVLAGIFEGFNDFSDAAYIYKQDNDNSNFLNCYNKAKKNIDTIEDGFQQFCFGILAKGQKDKYLAKLMFTKAMKNGVSQAREKINKLD